MKTLKITLIAALMGLSLNTFAETCNPCIISGNLKEESMVLSADEMPHDANVTDMLQKMTSTIRQQLSNVTGLNDKHQKHNKKKAHR